MSQTFASPPLGVEEVESSLVLLTVVGAPGPVGQGPPGVVRLLVPSLAQGVLSPFSWAPVASRHGHPSLRAQLWIPLRGYARSLTLHRLLVGWGRRPEDIQKLVDHRVWDPLLDLLETLPRLKPLSRVYLGGIPVWTPDTLDPWKAPSLVLPGVDYSPFDGRARPQPEGPGDGAPEAEPPLDPLDPLPPRAPPPSRVFDLGRVFQALEGPEGKPSPSPDQGGEPQGGKPQKA
jgi:hypothetical protein